MTLLRAALRAFEMQLKTRVVSPWSYLNWLIFPIIISAAGFFMLGSGGHGRTVYAALGGGVIGFWSVTYLEAGNGIQSERWDGTLEQVIGCPTPLYVIVAGKALASLLIGLLAFVPPLVAAALFFRSGLPRVDPVPFAVSVAVLTVSFFALAVMLSPLFAIWRWAFTLTNTAEFGVYALAGFMFPVTVLPAPVQAVAAALPPSWAVRALYAAAGQGGDPAYAA